MGTGAPRFYLPLDQQLPQPNFAQFVVTAQCGGRPRVAGRAGSEPVLREHFPRCARACRGWKTARRWAIPVQFRVSGDEYRARCAAIAEQVAAASSAPTDRTANVQFDWDEPLEAVGASSKSTRARRASWA